jgi:hypothetical protein
MNAVSGALFGIKVCGTKFKYVFIVEVTGV